LTNGRFKRVKFNSGGIISGLLSWKTYYKTSKGVFVNRNLHFLQMDHTYSTPLSPSLRQSAERGGNWLKYRHIPPSFRRLAERRGVWGHSRQPKEYFNIENYHNYLVYKYISFPSF